VLRRVFPADGTPLLLSEEEVVARASELPDGRAQARTYFHQQPVPRVEVELDAREPTSALEDMIDPLGREVLLDYRDRGGRAVVRPYQYTLSGRGRVQATAVLHEMETVSPGEMAAVLFALPNFWQIRSRVGSRVLLGAEFGNERWVVQLQEEADLDARVKRLRAVGGALITHQGTARRRDGTVFTAAEARELLEALHFFFSFARGAWSGPVLPVGVNDADSRMWERWDAPKTTSWSSAGTWIDILSGHLLAEAFPGFMRRWAAPKWRDTVARAVHWYVSASQQAGAVEGAIVLTQTALELLAWQILVNEEGRLSREQFKKRSAADRIRVLLELLAVPSAFPATLSVTAAAGGERTGWDGPRAIVALRNNIVHPLQHGGGALLNPEVLLEVWQLGLWYLELALLYAFEHRGGYCNRYASPLRVGHPEPVHWNTGEAGGDASV